MTHCIARNNRTVLCQGEYISSEGLCLRHACLFDIWIADYSGWKVYSFKGQRDVDNPTIGKENPEQLRRWKRAKFHRWLDKLNSDQVEKLLVMA